MASSLGDRTLVTRLTALKTRSDVFEEEMSGLLVEAEEGKIGTEIQESIYIAGKMGPLNDFFFEECGGHRITASGITYTFSRGTGPYPTLDYTVCLVLLT